MYKKDARDEAERVLSKNIYDMYMSSENVPEYNKKVKEISDKEHKIESYLKSMVKVYVERYATDEEVGKYERKRQTMSNRVPKYVKFCEDLFKIEPDKRIDYVDSTGESYGDVLVYLKKYKECHRTYSHLVDEFYDKYSLLMEDRRQKENDERIRKNFKDACNFFDDEVISKGFYSVADYADYVNDKNKKRVRSYAEGRRKIIIARNPDVWECYLRKMEVNRTYAYVMLKNNFDSFVNQMVDGFRNGRPVDVIDYYMTVGNVSFKKFKDICEGHLSKSVISLFNIFITPYLNMENGVEVKDYFRINYTNLETGKTASEEEKICIYEFLRNNDIPEVYFPIAVNKYLNGDLDIKYKSLKKEI